MAVRSVPSESRIGSRLRRAQLRRLQGRVGPRERRVPRQTVRCDRPRIHERRRRRHRDPAPDFGAGTETLTRVASWLNHHLHLSARPSSGCSAE